MEDWEIARGCNALSVVPQGGSCVTYLRNGQSNAAMLVH